MIKKSFDYQKTMSVNLFATLLFVFIFFFTFDTYGLNQVSPELVLINLFGMPFARMELVAILFSLTFAVGTAASLLLKNKSKKILSLSLAVIGVVTMLVAILDVDLLQSLLPTMRISHVIMTLSKLSAFAIGAMGLFVGFNFATITKYASKIDIKVIIIVLAIAFIVSILSIAENLYLAVYFVLAVFIFVAAIVSQYTTDGEFESVEKKNFDLLFEVSDFVVTLGIVFAILTANLFMMFTLQFEIYSCLAVLLSMGISFALARYVKICERIKYVIFGISAVMTIVSVFAQVDILFILSSCLVMFTFGSLKRKEKQSSLSILISSGGAFVGAVLAYVFNHFVSDVTTFSGNRVVYAIKSWFFLLILAAMSVGIIIRLIIQVRSGSKNNDL